MPEAIKEEPSNPAPHLIKLHAAFQPDSVPPGDLDPLMNLWIEVQDRMNRVSTRELARKKREWRNLEQAFDKLSPLFNSVLRGDRDASSAADDARELVPQEDLRRKVFDWYSELITRKQEETEESKKENDSARQELAAREKLLKSSGTVLNSLEQLCDAVEAGEPGAEDALLEAAVTATTLLSISVRKHPERFKAVAAMNQMWPVLAKEEPGWEKAALEQVAGLDLGKGLSALKTRLRQVRGSDVNLPARRWAKAAVRTIDETRWRGPFVLHIIEKLGVAERGRISPRIAVGICRNTLRGFLTPWR